APAPGLGDMALPLCSSGLSVYVFKPGLRVRALVASKCFDSNARKQLTLYRAQCIYPGFIRYYCRAAKAPGKAEQLRQTRKLDLEGTEGWQMKIIYIDQHGAVCDALRLFQQSVDHLRRFSGIEFATYTDLQTVAAGTIYVEHMSSTAVGLY